MKKIKFFLIALCLMLGFGLSINYIDAASVTRSGYIESNYAINYTYRYRYSATIGYNSPGNGQIYSYSDLTFSQLTYGSGYKVELRQVSKTINASKTAVTYNVAADVSVFLGIGSYMYVGTQNNYITISSPGPMRSINNNLGYTVEEGDLYYDTDVAKLYEMK